MPLFFYTSKLSDDTTQLFFAEIPKGKAKVQSRNEEDKGETSNSGASKSNYEKLPDYLKSCLDYCYIVSEIEYGEKKELVQVLLAEGLVVEKPGEILEDTTANILQELVALGLLLEFNDGNGLRVPKLHREACLFQVEEQDFVNEAKDLPVHVVIKCDGEHLAAINFKSLVIRSLFVKAENPDFQFNQAFLETIRSFQFLAVLVLNGRVMCLPEKVGDLVNLRYLGLYATLIQELPGTVGHLQKLQTLDVNFSQLQQLPKEILDIQQLRHLSMLGYSCDVFVRIPKGIGNLMNLQSWIGIRSGCGVADELRNLSQLRILGIECLSEEYATEVSEAITKMENLVSLSLSAPTEMITSGKKICILPDLEAFSLPPHLQRLHLRGGLIEIPNWVSSMENLISLELYQSDLLENPSRVVQFFPRLKYLTLWEAYSAKLIGKEFREEGGFPKLESLTVCSSDLVEWTSITKGCFPSLRFLLFFNCRKLRFLPEGLEYICTLQQLFFSCLHGDLARRLRGQENYKVNHIQEFIVLGEFS